MTTKTLIARHNIGGEELVCLSPWFYESLAESLKKLNTRIAELETMLEVRGYDSK